MTDETSITRTEKSVKIKDPKRVECGRNLGKSSNMYKERKMREKILAESALDSEPCGITGKIIIGVVVGVSVLAVSTYLGFNKVRDAITNSLKTKEDTNEVSEDKEERVQSNLLSLDD